MSYWTSRFKAGIDSSDPDRPVGQHPLRYPSLCRPPPPAHRAVGSRAPYKTTGTWALSEASGRNDRTECNVPGEHDPKDSIPNRDFPHDVSSMRPSHAASKPTDVWRAVEVGAQIGTVYEHAGDRCRRNHEWASSGWRRARRAPPMSPMKICIAVAVARFVCGETFSAGQESNSAA
jgi:hypothetical protein